jgi:hypothetical protein
MPVIPASQEAEIGRSQSEARPGIVSRSKKSQEEVGVALTSGKKSLRGEAGSQVGCMKQADGE